MKFSMSQLMFNFPKFSLARLAKFSPFIKYINRLPVYTIKYDTLDPIS